MSVRSHAFGLSLDLPDSSLGLPPATEPLPGTRSSRLAYASHVEGSERWRPDDVVRIVDRKGPDGLRRVMTVDRDATLGYRYWAHGLGYCLISADGGDVLCVPETPDVDLWQRFLVGQILPFLPPLHGLEVMHGSAVEVDGAAVAFLTGSGGGKTSLAAQFVLAGGSFVTDDVLALEVDGAGVVVHPGPAAMGIRHREAERLGSRRLADLGPGLAENAKEVVVGVDRASRPVPLAAMYFIRHESDATELGYEPSPEPELLLGSTFNTVLTEPERMERMLDVCAGIARGVRTTKVTVPPDLDAERLAQGLMTHLTDGG